MNDLTRQEMDAKIDASTARLEAKFTALCSEVRTGFAQLSAHVDTGFAQMRADHEKMRADNEKMRADNEKMRADMHGFFSRMSRWMLATVLLIIGTMVAGMVAFYQIARAPQPALQGPIIITVPGAVVQTPPSPPAHK